MGEVDRYWQNKRRSKRVENLGDHRDSEKKRYSNKSC